MADTGPLRVADLNAKTTPGAGDLVEIVDVSDTADPKASDAQGSNKQVTFTNFQAAVLAGISGYVPTSTTVNGHALTGNITVTASDVGLGNVLNTSTANTLAGYNASGNFADVTIGSGLSLSGGVLTNTGGGATYTADETTLNLSGTNVFSILSTYVGQTSITTLGTVTTGTWAGTTVAVNHGGTGATTLTAHGVLLGEGTSAIVATAAMTNGQLLVGATGADPAPQTVSGSGATITMSAAGVVTISAVANATLTNSSITLNTHAVSLGGSLSLTATDIGLGSVTNNAQTKAAVVPNTAPTAGQILLGNAGGTAYAPQSLSGVNCTLSLSSAGALTVTALATAAIAANAVTYAKLQTETASTLLGNPTGAGAVPSEITLGTNLSFSGSVLNATGGGGGTVIPSTNDYRLTLQSGQPWMTSDQVGATVIYLTQAKGDYIATYDSGTWTLHEPGETSVTLSGLTAGKNYDVFAYFLGGTFKIDLGPTWNAGAVAGSDTARGTGAGSTDIVKQNGIWTNTNSMTGAIHGDTIAANAGRYLGTIRTTGTTTTEFSTKITGSGAAPSSTAKFFVWNADNRDDFEFAVIDGTSTWTVTAGNWATMNGSNNNRFECIVGLDRRSRLDINVTAGGIFGPQGYASVGLQEDGTGGGAASNQCDSGYRCGVDTQSGSEQMQVPLAGFLRKRVPLGYHFYQALQWALTSSTTIIGTDTSSQSRRTGIFGSMEM